MLKNFIVLTITFFSMGVSSSCENYKMLSEKWSACIEEEEMKFLKCLNINEMVKKSSCITKIKALKDLDEVKPKIKTIKSKIVFNVSSGGCTNSKDFLLTLQSKNLKIYRLVNDTCEGHYPNGVKIKIPLHEIGLKTSEKFRYNGKEYIAH